jgi:hypothetical protein
MEIDLRCSSFDDWLSFVFDHEVVPEGAEGEARKEWYWAVDDDEIAIDPARQIAFLRQMFEHPAILLPRFTPRQINQGFWCMFGGWGDQLFRGQLWNHKVPWEERAAAISAIESLYQGLFGVEEVGTSGFMLWDLLAYDYYCGQRHPENDLEDRRVQQLMFETLERMLLASSEETQRAALHGLHHLMHPDCMSAVRRFLAERHPSVRVVEYAERVLSRTVQ